MFTNHIISDDLLIRVEFSKYSINHFLKKFRKNYKGKQWEVTEESIFNELSRMAFKDNNLQFSQQVDELRYFDNQWIFKYDFSVAKTRLSPKTSGNRCIVYLCMRRRLMKIMVIYNKNNLPGNCSETRFIEEIIKNEFGDILDLLKGCK